MNNTRLRECRGGARQQFGYVETDPSGRYGRFREILGKGAMKTVYKAFDEVLGMEVAWNQVKLNSVFNSPDELQRLYSEVHLLKNLDHDSIMRFHTSWIDLDGGTFNFISEMFTSGTLREYRQKYKRVDIGVIKNWARQILHGLAYLHGHDPPVIHRDLKCDNIFVNGHLGQVKIGDLGLAAILRGSQHAHSVIGTPEFMAPELYEEEYDELVDVYSFGMCVLEMLTSEYPYSECSNPAQIYKKVTSGKLPEAFYRIEDVEAREFVGRCLEPVAKRLPAKELLMDPFLAVDHGGQMLPMLRVSSQKPSPNGTVEKIPSFQTNPRKRSTDMTITGTINPDDYTIFLKVAISDKDGRSRNIYFPFDIGSDTPIDVATEMVRELEITDWEPFEIAKMIEEEIFALVPSWKQWTSPENHQHSFVYEEEEEEDDDDDDKTYHPFYCYASESSRVGLQDLSISCEIQSQHRNHMISGEDWFQEGLLINDDASSQSSLNSEKYSTLVYCSVTESDTDHLAPKRVEPIFTASTHKSTRFCPEEGTSSWNQCNGSRRPYDSNCYRKLSRIKSFVDVRSQLLRRSLMEMINKRRLFKTIGAVENIGYQEPGEFPKEMSLTGGFSGNSPRNSEKQRFKC
ncbi:hypothetical protein PVL29_009910 [Vitis rotundifolia]|uniref:non-specific serine/threonine protein kinase n=1 Tax=Vitis rotundifolia TaxID=103349 RepID=A0AA38ZRV7_VITRO|nr:hypothetical protein PVL29_009910 [Vitis rotundifolia]